MPINTANPELKIQELTAENQRLENEIESLRAQIDGMQGRTKELTKSNKELREQIESLSKSKSDLEKLQTQKDDLFAQVIHDIKNPASLIKNLVELLTSYDLQASDQQEVIQDIMTTTTRIVNLSQELSKVMALEGSKINLDLMVCQLNEVIEDCARINRTSAENKGINFTLELNKHLPEIEIDPQRIAEVIDNFLSNAIKFTPKGGSVKIKNYKRDNAVITEIIDNGLGLNEEDIKRAFNKGARLSAKPTAGENSSGLGLWIIKKLVEVHKGRVWVKSAIGRGSTFFFSLPIRQEDALSQN